MVNIITIIRHNVRHLAHGIFKCIFLNENLRILTKMSFKYVSKRPITNKPGFAQIHVMGRRRTGDKALSKPMVV